MKKINAIFIILISFLLFTLKFEDFNRWYATNISVPFRNYVMNHEHSNEVNLFIDINSVEDDKDKLILDFIEKIDFPSGILELEDSISTNYSYIRWYIHGNVNKIFNGLYGLDTISSINDNEDYFITNDKEDERGSHLIRFLDNRYYNFSSSYFSKLEFLPMEKLSNVENPLSIVFLVEDDDLDLFFNKVDLAVNDNLRISNTQVINHDIYSHGNFSHGLSYYFKLPKPILYISTVTLILLLYLETKANHKEITIRSLHGNSRIKVFRKLMFKTIATNILLFLLTQVLMYIVYVRNFSPLARSFLSTLYPDVFVYILILVIFVILFYIYFNLIMKPSSLKSRSQSQITLTIVVVIKVLAMVLLTIPLIESEKEYKLYREHYHSLKHDKTGIDNITIGFHLNSSPDREIRRWLFDFIEKNQLGLRDGFEYVLNTGDTPEEAMKGYNPSIPFIMMNQTSIQDYVFIDENQSEIDLDKFERENWVLVPLRYKNEIKENGIKCFGDCIIEYYTNEVLISNMAGVSFGKSKLIYVMKEFTDEYDFLYGITDTMINGEMRPELQMALKELESIIPEHILSIVYGDDILRFSQDRYNQSSIEFITQLVLSMLLILLFAYTYISIYFESKSKELAVMYLNGLSYLKRYYLLFGILITSNTATIVVLNHFKKLSLQYRTQSPGWLPLDSIFRFYSILTLIELVVIVLIIRRFEKKNIASVIKGNES